MIARRRSRLHGWGVFATERIPKNKRIIHYAGEKITHRESERREATYLTQGRIWCFLLDDRWVIDGNVGGNDWAFGGAFGYRYYFNNSVGLGVQIAYHHINGFDINDMWDSRLGVWFKF